jgi:hypothetical protein
VDDEELSFWAAFWNEEHHAEFQEWYSSEPEERIGRTPELPDYQYDDLQEQVITGRQAGTSDVTEGVIEHPADYVNAGIIEPLTDRMDELDYPRRLQRHRARGVRVPGRTVGAALRRQRPGADLSERRPREVRLRGRTARGRTGVPLARLSALQRAVR